MKKAPAWLAAWREAVSLLSKACAYAGENECDRVLRQVFIAFRRRLEPLWRADIERRLRGVAGEDVEEAARAPYEKPELRRHGPTPPKSEAVKLLDEIAKAIGPAAYDYAAAQISAHDLRQEAPLRAAYERLPGIIASLIDRSKRLREVRPAPENLSDGRPIPGAIKVVDFDESVRCYVPIETHVDALWTLRRQIESLRVVENTTLAIAPGLSVPDAITVRQPGGVSFVESYVPEARYRQIWNALAQKVAAINKFKKETADE